VGLGLLIGHAHFLERWATEAAGSLFSCRDHSGSRWQWSWANSNIPDDEKLDIEKVREFGETKGFEKLTAKFLDADEYTGWEMTAVTVHVLKSPGSYRFPTEHGYCYLVYREVEEVSKELQSEERPRIHEEY